jgi:hypothetical protein
MDSFLFEQFAPVPQMIPQSKYEVPSFEEAFDTNSLKNFYRDQSSPNHFEAKFRRDFGLDEDIQTHSFEAISPATTAQSQSFMDFFHPRYEDMRQDNSPRAALNLRDHLSPVQCDQNQVAKGIRFNENQGMKRQESQVSQSDPNNLIAMLCEQMKQYYEPQQEIISNRPQFVKGETEPFFARRFISLDRETSVSFSDSSVNRLEETVLRKLIFKKKIFTIQRNQKNTKDLKVKRKNSEVNSLKLKKRAQSVHLPASLFNDETGLAGKMLVEEEKKSLKIRRKHSEAVGKEVKEAKAPRKKSEKLEKKEKKEKKEKTPKISPQQSEPVQNIIFGNLTLN